MAPNWLLKPSGIARSGQFRLLFVTGGPAGAGIRDATSTDIAVYNRFVQDLVAQLSTTTPPAAANRPFASQYRVVGSTSSVDARTNTGTTGTGVPIYWLDGNKVADNYADFYDGNWDDETNATTQLGSLLANVVRVIWSGSNHDGTSSSRPLGNSPFVFAGRRQSSTVDCWPFE